MPGKERFQIPARIFLHNQLHSVQDLLNEAEVALMIIDAGHTPFGEYFEKYTCKVCQQASHHSMRDISHPHWCLARRIGVQLGYFPDMFEALKQKAPKGGRAQPCYDVELDDEETPL